VELSGVGFGDLHNTRTISAGTLTLHYVDELAPTSLKLAAAVDAGGNILTLQSPANCTIGTLMQVGVEVMVVQGIASGGTLLDVDRGAYETTAASHETDTAVLVLKRRTSVVPFVRGFFGTPASGSYSHAVVLPGARVVVGEFFVTNAQGNSQVSSACYSGFEDRGIRTLSGGQYTFQVDGPAAIQSGAAPSLTADATRSVRDVFATVSEAPMGGDLLARVTSNGQPYCELRVGSGTVRSSSVNGLDLPPLSADTTLGLDVLEVGSSTPGAGLTVTIRV
jgi:hypothetical protein